MNNDFYKLVSRFNKLIILILLTTATSMIIFFVFKINTDENNKNIKNMQTIQNFINSQNTKLTNIKNQIYLDKEFQNNLAEYLTLTPSDYIINNLKKDLSSDYLTDKLSAYYLQQNNDNSIVGLSISSDANSYISTRGVPSPNTLSFYKSLGSIDSSFDNSLLSMTVSTENLVNELIPGQYHYQLSDGSSTVNLSEESENVYNISPISSILYSDCIVKTYYERSYFTKNILLYVVIIYFIMILIVLLINYFSKKSFNDYLVQYSDIINSLEKSKHSNNIRINISNKKGELAELAKKINYYYDENEKFIETQAEFERLKQEAYFSSLQNQITPHFLFNNLEFIRMKAFLTGQEEISEYIYLLSQLYRNNSYQEEIIDISEELNNIELFMSLYKIRYKNIDFKIYNNITHLKLPKLSLQPFAENFIKHGFNSLQDNNLLEIHCHESKNEFKIIIKDNGRGISTEELESLISQIHHKQKFDEHIGIRNSLSRLNLIYNNKLNFEINSQKDQFFMISITISKE